MIAVSKVWRRSFGALRVAAVGLEVRSYFYRYSEDALDLCDVLGSYLPGAKVRLDEVSKILGLLGKPEGQIDEVARYCESDVLNTYRVCLSTNYSGVQSRPKVERSATARLCCES